MSESHVEVHMPKRDVVIREALPEVLSAIEGVLPKGVYFAVQIWSEPCEQCGSAAPAGGGSNAPGDVVAQMFAAYARLGTQ